MASATTEQGGAQSPPSQPRYQRPQRPLRQRPQRSQRQQRRRRNSEHIKWNSSSPDADSLEASSNATSKEEQQMCTPVGECELCPSKWKTLLEIDEGDEYESCVSHERRQKFECTVLFHEAGFSEKRARSRHEYRSCVYTEADEEFRMLRMQILCLLVGIWSLRTARRQKMASASLFDQRRMMRNRGGGGVGSSSNKNSGSGSSSTNGNVGGDSRGKYSVLPRDDSMETIELTRNARDMVGKGIGKVPKSPSPNLQTV